MNAEKFLHFLRKKAESYNQQDKNKGRLYYCEKYECWNVKPLDAEDILKLLHKMGTRCYYCGRMLIYKSHIKFKNSLLTLDRIDNTLSHTINNCLIACYLCNTMRGNAFTSEHFKEIKNRI